MNVINIILRLAFIVYIKWSGFIEFKQDRHNFCSRWEESKAN